MTTRSTRQALEQRIIDKAYLFEATNNYFPLFAALCEHRDLGLQIPDQPALSHNSTDTSAAAGASLKDISGDARLCYDEIHLAGGLTVDQLCLLLNREHQTISARVNGLRNNGWIGDSGMRRKTRRGRAAIVWVPTTRAKQLR